MKYLLVLQVVVLGLWLLLRQGGGGTPPADPPRRKPARGKPPDNIVACAHCDLRLPEAEAMTGTDGRRYCSEAHRLAGPR
jgi:uncharacterized protein